MIGEWYDSDLSLPDHGDLCVGWRKKTKEYVFFVAGMGTASAQDFDRWLLLCKAPQDDDEV